MTDAAAAVDVVFIDHAPRGLQAGTYRVKVRHRVRVPAQGVDETFTATEVFAVEAPRFALDPAAIDSTYPPNGACGQFGAALPHIVLAQPSLPWLRSADPGGHDAPWLAVLVLDEADWDGPKDAVARTVGDLRAPGPGVLSHAPPASGHGWSAADACRTIDVPAETFARIAPSRMELSLLCHVRQVQPARKGGGTSPDATQEFAVVAANRLPALGRKHVAHLVSLEGFADLLPCSHGTASPRVPVGTRTIRLVSLASWSFEVSRDEESFTDVVSGAQRDVFRLPPSASDDAQVARALHLGYLPLAHRMRGGGSAPSWYRGPFAPYAPRLTLRCPILSADAALRFDEATGMLDASHAAAWQLGRMLALQDQEMAAALLAWKRVTRRDAIARAQQALLRAHLGDLAPPMPDAGTAPPAGVQRWLARLRLLHGVPFPYLVPDERLLPPESVRFFHVDPNWVEALLDGAFSVGRSCEGDLVHEREGQPLRATGPDEGTTGLLLRSRAVVAWPGIEATATARDGTRLAVARRERLAPDLLLLLFDGAARDVELHQPSEALHFGFHAPARFEDRSGFTRPLRRLVAGDGQAAGDTTAASVPLALRGGADGVVAVWKLARALRRKHDDTVGATKRFTAAEFAIEMVEGPGSVLFTVE